MKSEATENSEPTFVVVCDENSPDDTLELPLESNGTLAQSTLQAQFPGATGLKYKKEGSDRYRGVRVAEGFIYPPEDGSWANIVFVATFPKAAFAGGKRKADDSSDSHAVDGSSSKESKVDRTTSDLIVLSLPYKAGEAELRQYFSQFGTLAACDIKRDKDGHSRGFGFVRFQDFTVQEKVLAMRHYIDGRWCDVKIPNSQIMHENNQQPSNCSSRVFVGRLAPNVTEEQIRTFFGKFGPVTDIYLPRPFRSCAFVTFRDISVAQGLVGKEFQMDGNTIHIACANPRMKDGNSGQSGNFGGNMQGGNKSHSGGNDRYEGGRGSFNSNNNNQSGAYSGGFRSGGGRGGHNNDMNGSSNGNMGGNQGADFMSYFGNFGNFGGGNQGMFQGQGNRGGNSTGNYNNRGSNSGNNMSQQLPAGGSGNPANMMNSAAFIAALSSVIGQGGWNAGGPSGSGPANPYSASNNFGDSFGNGGGSGGFGGGSNTGQGGGGFGNNSSAMYR